MPKRRDAKPPAKVADEPVPGLEGEGSIGEWVPIESLREWPGNPRKNAHAYESVAASLKLYGFGRPLVARREDREIVVGHTAFNAAKLLGLKNVPVRFVDLSPEKAHALAIADNKLGELAQWDDRMLLAQLQELEANLPDFDAADLGLVQEDLDRLDRIAKSEAPVEGQDPGAEEPPADPVSKRGEIYALGPTRLVCPCCGESMDE